MWMWIILQGIVFQQEACLCHAVDASGKGF